MTHSVVICGKFLSMFGSNLDIMILWTLLFCFYGCVIKTHGQQLIDCSKTGPCSCSSAEGVIDLSPLDSMNSSSSRYFYHLHLKVAERKVMCVILFTEGHYPIIKCKVIYWWVR